MRRVAEPPVRHALWLHGLWPDRNPLRRASDRIQTAVIAAALLAFLIGGPLIAIGAGHWAGTIAARVQQAQQDSWRQVPAVLLANAGSSLAVGYGGESAAEVRARWTAPDGAVRTGNVPAPAGALKGARVPIWVDGTGQLTGPPLRPDQATGQAFLAAVTAPLVLGFVILCLASVVIRVLDRRRMAAWDADWQATEPRWTSRR
jgi:hypothetical protein